MKLRFLKSLKAQGKKKGITLGDCIQHWRKDGHFNYELYLQITKIKAE